MTATITVTRREFRAVEPPVLYFGSLVALLSTLNPDGSANLAPNSSAWALGRSLVIGLGEEGQTLANLRRHGELVVNLPEHTLWERVERLAPLTGRDPVPEHKAALFRHEPDKFGAAGLTPLAAERVAPPRVAECAVHLEAAVRAVHRPASEGFAIVEAEVVRVHARTDLVPPGTEYIDTARWRPLVYVFRHFFALGADLGRTFRAER